MRFLELAKTFENIEATRKRGEISANLAEALRRADPEEAKIIAYLIQGRLGPPYAAPDLGLVAYVSMTEGEKGLERIHPIPGRPVLPALAQRLPSPAAAVTRLGRVLVEPKYDGLRLQLHKDGRRVWLFTRRLEDITGALPSLVEAAKDQIQATKVILDGEVIGYDPKTKRFLSFQETVRRKRKHQVEEMSFLYPVRYYGFDILSLNRQDLIPKPQYERSQKLAQVIKEKQEGSIFKTPQIETDSAEELVKFLHEMLSKRLEGVVVKRPDAPYHVGARLFDWIKIKREHSGQALDTYDLVVVGYFKGRGKRSRLGVGSLLCAVYDPSNARFRTVTRVGSGLSDEEWKDFHKKLDKASLAAKSPQVDSLIQADVWVEPHFVIEVAAAEITRSPRHTCGRVDNEQGYSLRFPRMVQFRFDRRPDDATTEKEIVDLYQAGVGNS